MECELHGHRLRVYKDSTIERWVKNSWTLLKPFVHKCGYQYISLYCNSKRKIYRVNRVVAFVYFPFDISDKKVYIQHIDKNMLNNQLSNLRFNQTKPHFKSSGLSGVVFNKTKKMFEVYFTTEFETILVGNFHSKSEAQLAYVSRM